MPASSGTNTRDFMCFFLFWLISLPLIWFPVHSMSVRAFFATEGASLMNLHSDSRHFFVAKMIVTPIAAMMFLVWCIVKAHGIGPIIRQPSTIQGSSLAWAMVVSLMSCISNSATLVTYGIFTTHTCHLTQKVVQECARLCIPREDTGCCAVPPTFRHSSDMLVCVLDWHSCQFFVTGHLWGGDMVAHRPVEQIFRR